MKQFLLSFKNITYYTYFYNRCIFKFLSYIQNLLEVFEIFGTAKVKNSLFFSRFFSYFK